MLIRSVQESERSQLLDLLEICFDERRLFERYIECDPEFRWNDVAVVESAGRLVACTQVFRKQIRLAGTVIRLGGIGSVATHPEYRGRGLARDLLLEREQYMRDEGFPLGLLFTDIPEFYAKLGWVALPLRQFQLQFADGPVDSAFRIREFGPEDLDAIRALFEAYASRFEGAIVRNAAYWRGQLRYAGNPSEDFRVVETRGQIAAYARCAPFGPTHVLMEHAYLPGAELALSQLMRAQLCGHSGLLRLPVDAELESALAESTVRFEREDDPSPMWRVIDAREISRLSSRDDDRAPDTALLDDLIVQRGVHYWTSDRY